MVWQVNGESGDGTLYYIEAEAPPPDENIVYSYGD
jgi:hypothetical protein